MKKIILAAAVMLLASASCNQIFSGAKTQNQTLKTGKISSISIEPSKKEANWTMYENGAVIKVMGENLQSVEIKYYPTGTGQSEQSLGQAASLSSQQGAWALPLPKGIMATGMWAEGKGENGQVVKSQDLGNVGYEELNGYKSPDRYGFAIEYPKDFGFNTDIKQIQALGYIPVCDQTTLACVFYAGDAYKGTNFEAAGVSVNLLKDLNSESKCYNFSVSTNEAQQAAGTHAINGVDFKSATGGQGAAGHFMKTQVYRNFHNNQCYEIAQRVGSTNIGNYEPGTVKEFNQDEVWGRLQSIVDSFRFTK